MTTTKQKWTKSDEVPTLIYERQDDGYTGYMADSIRPAPGVVLGPLGVSKSTYGWRVVHVATGRLVHRGISFNTRAQAKRYAEGMLLTPGIGKLLTVHAQDDGKFSPDADPIALQNFEAYGRIWHPDSKKWDDIGQATPSI